MRMLGCVGMLVALGWLAMEVWAYVGVAHFLNSTYGDVVGTGGWWLPLVWMVVVGVVGVRVVRYHVAQIMPALLMGRAGQHVVGALGGVLLALPGLISDVFGLVLLLPPVQKLLGRLGNAIVASLVKRTMGSMFGGAGGGMAGGAGFPFAAGGFMPKSRVEADDRAAFPKAGRTYDTTATREP